MRAEAEPWWRQAEADLRTAELALAGGQYYAGSWFAQQAAEKELKALFIERHGQLAPRTHDLRFLGARLRVPRDVQTDLDILNPTFDMARYPDPLETARVDAIGLDDATEHVDAARRTLAWISSQFNPPSTRR